MHCITVIKKYDLFVHFHIIFFAHERSLSGY